MFANADAYMPQHLASGEARLERGSLYRIDAKFAPTPMEGGIFYVYWTLPGEGVALAPLRREFLHPADGEPRLTGVRHWCSVVWRKLWLLALVLFIPVLAFTMRRSDETVAEFRS